MLTKANIPFIIRARVVLLRDLGSPLSPFNSWVIIQGWCYLFVMIISVSVVSVVRLIIAHSVYYFAHGILAHIQLGLETLALRIKQHSSNAEKVVQYLLTHPKVDKVQPILHLHRKDQVDCRKDASPEMPSSRSFHLPIIH